MPETVTSSNGFGRKLRATLVQGLKERGIDAAVETEDVRHTSLVRALVTSPQFQDMNPRERQELIWRIIRQQLTADEQLRVGLVVPLTPDEIGS